MNELDLQNKLAYFFVSVQVKGNIQMDIVKKHKFVLFSKSINFQINQFSNQKNVR